MSAIKSLIKKQGQFTVKCNKEQDLENNETGSVLLEKGKSYSQTFTINDDATDDAIKNTIDAVLSLSIGVNDVASGADMSGSVSTAKKIVSTYMLIQE